MFKNCTYRKTSNASPVTIRHGHCFSEIKITGKLVT